jgi:hypothetical protein
MNPAKRAETEQFEIAAARMYVQDQLAIDQIAQRLRCRDHAIRTALKRCGIAIETRRVWAL